MNKTPKVAINDNQLDAKLAQLSHRIEPENDLWPEIASQLPTKTGAWWQGNSAVAASLLGGLLGIGLAGVTQFENSQLRQTLAATTSAAAISSQSASMMPVAMSASSNDELCLQPSQSQVIQHNLAIIQSAINEINTALEQSPNNAALNKRLLDLSKQQVNLINRANAISL